MVGPDIPREIEKRFGEACWTQANAEHDGRSALPKPVGWMLPRAAAQSLPRDYQKGALEYQEFLQAKIRGLQTAETAESVDCPQ